MGTATPATMRTEDLEAAIAEFPAKKKVLREAFDCLAACSPYPLPFTWEDLDAHVSSAHSSISGRFRQLQVLEAARPAQTGENQEGSKEEEGEEEEEVEEEIEEEEEEEVEEEIEEEIEEEVEEEEEEEEEGDEVEEVEEEEEEVEEEVEVEIEEEVEEEDEEQGEEEDTEEEGAEEEANKEMQDAKGNFSNQAKDNNNGSVDEDQDADEETLVTKVSSGQDNDAEGETQEINQDLQEDEEELDTEDKVVAKLIKKQLRRLPPCRSEDLVVACERMDAGTLAQFIIRVNVVLKKEFLDAMFHAPDPAALVLQVVKLFLSSKNFKCAKVWLKCVTLIRWLSMAPAKPSADTIVEAKLVAKDWKEMIDRKDSCGEFDMQSAWGLLHFLISYNIVSVFNIHEIIHIFAMVRLKNNKKETVKLCEDLGLTDRITDLIDHQIGNGQHIEAFRIVQAFNLKDMYPLLSLLKGLVEKVKQTSSNQVKPKEVNDLCTARQLAENEIVDSSQRRAIVAEIKYLLGIYAKKQNQSNKKRKKEDQVRLNGPHSLQLQELNQNKLIQGKQHQMHQQENKMQVKQQEVTLKLPIPAVPLVPNVARIQNFGCPPYASMPGIHSYPAQPGWPGGQGATSAPQLRAPWYLGPPFNPFPPHPPFCPR